LKLASYIHISSSPVVSISQVACRYLRPIFLVIQNSIEIVDVTKTHASYYPTKSPRANISTITTTFAPTI
jgi:hypothetical protein